jgi:hypothetical protein
MTSVNSSLIQQVMDGYFPVRIRMPGGPEGISGRLNEMHRWLHQRLGLKRFCQTGQPLNDLYFCFEEISVAREFAQHFQCELVEITNRLAS